MSTPASGQLAPSQRRRLARSFGPLAETYERVRPSYPTEAAAWMIGDAARVADVGAGTGKMTRVLLSLSREVVAVEPDGLMRESLARALPGTTALEGTGEQLPLEDASMDALVYAQSWHWTDPVVASVEAGRVLADDGVLALVWNTRDHTTPWVQVLSEVWGETHGEAITRLSHPPFGAPFSRAEHATWHWARPMSPEEIVGLAASRSPVITLPDDARSRLLDSIRQVLATHPDLAGREQIEMPYVTQAWRITR